MPVRIFGKIDGTTVGGQYDNRKALAAAGIHRPHVAGISGSANEGADSIVLSGGYEDDEDFGDEIIYTGHGGHAPNSTVQIADQTFDKQNKALAISCDRGLPVRVTRGAGHKSPHSPSAGYRYDGLFFVEEYWRERGLAGYRIWRFRLRRLTDGDRNQFDAGSSGDRQGNQPTRVETTVQRIVRDTAIARQVKESHRYRCQVCGLALQTPSGPYAEGAHIRPLGAPHNGPDVAENILCLCPNHHLLFDRGAFTISDELSASETGQPLRTVACHTIDPEFIRYHREHYGVGEKT